MPALKYPQSRFFRNRRQRLAIWLLLGCVPSGLLECEMAQADGIEWGQVQTPAFDGSNPSESNASRKTPSIRPTESVNSVLGIRGEFAGGGASMSGTSIQLLPPKAPPAAPQVAHEPAIDSATAAADRRFRRSPVRSSSPAQMVTRDNANIMSYKATWQPRVPSFNPREDEVVLIGPVQDSVPEETPSRIASLGIPESNDQYPNQMRPEGSSAPLASPSASDASMVGDRQYFPSFIQPRESSTTRTKVADSARAPLPNELLLEQPTASRIVGSGLSQPRKKVESETSPVPQSIGSVRSGRPRTKPTALAAGSETRTNTEPAASAVGSKNEEDLTALPLAPVSKMPVFEGPQTDVSQNAVSSEPNLLEELESLLPPENQEVERFSDKQQTDNDGSNEGQTESDEDLNDVELPTDLTMELLLEGAGEIESIPEEDDSNESMTEIDDDSPALSSMKIKPLNPPPPKEVLEVIAPGLESVESDLDLRDIHDEIEPLKAAPLRQLDATGRVKNHSGPGAVERLSPMAVRLKSPILQTLRSFHARTERADSRSNWGMMHQIMVYGADTRILARNRNYSAIAWMAGNNVCRGSRLMTSSRGKIQVREGTGLQGHQAQFLAIMSLVGVPSDYPLYVGNQRFDMKDLVEVEAAACEEGKELTFTLIGLAHYLDTDTTWTGVGGEQWDFNRLIAAELSQPIVGAACGGTHRLMCFAHALRKRRLEGQPIDGQWKRAENFLDEFVQYTYSLQNRDGSMSTNWFESREDNGDMKRKVQTTGHMVEFLLTHLPDEDLADERMTRAITFLNNAMRRIQIDDAAVGYRGHALRSLAMYYRRMYGEAADYPAPSMTQQRSVQRRR